MKKILSLEREKKYYTEFSNRNFYSRLNFCRVSIGFAVLFFFDPSVSLWNSRCFFKWNLMLKFLRNKRQYIKFGKNRTGKRTIYMNTYMRLHEDLQAFTWGLKWFYMKTYLRLLEDLQAFTWILTWYYTKTYMRLHEDLQAFTRGLTWFYMNTYMPLHEDLQAFTWILTWYYMKTYMCLHENYKRLREDLCDFTWRSTYRKNLQRNLLNIYKSRNMFRTIT